MDHAEALVPRLLVTPDVDTVDRHTAGRRPQEAEYQVDERRLSSTGGPDDANEFASFNRQIDLGQRVAMGALVPDRDVSNRSSR